MQLKINKKIIIFVLVILLLVGISFAIGWYITEESKCSSNEDCKEFSCPDEVGRNIAKCDPNTETCYCGGECGDGYCNSYEESFETCPEDCKVEINLCPMSDAPESSIGCPIGRGYPDPDYPLFGYTNADQLIAHSVFDEEDGEYMLLKKDDELSITISDVAGGQYHVTVKAIEGSCSGQFMFGETVDFIIDTETKSYNLNLQSAGFDMKITNGECNVDMIKIEEVKERLIDCKKEFGTEYWCADYDLWEAECQGKGTYKKIEGVCNSAGQSYCVTCKEEPKVVDCKEAYGEGYWCADYNLWEAECQGKGDVKRLREACNEAGDTNCVTCREEELQTFTLTLYPGWNLISFPLQPENPKIEAVLAPIEGKYEIISDTINSYRPLGISSLPTLEAGKGYWIKITSQEPVKLPITGTPLDVTLKSWPFTLKNLYSCICSDIYCMPRRRNIIGYPFLTSINIADIDFGVEYSEILRYKPGQWSSTHPDDDCEHKELYFPDERADDFTTLDPGRGYWIKVLPKKTEVTFTVVDSKNPEQKIYGAAVNVFKDKKQIANCITNDKGTCCIALVENQKYSVQGAARDYISNEPITFTSEKNTSVTTALKKGGCSDCGTGLMNICDEEECNKLGDCVYKESLIGGECLETVEIELVMIDNEPIEEGQELTTEGEFLYTVEIKCNKPECGDISVSLKTEIEK